MTRLCAKHRPKNQWQNGREKSKINRDRTCTSDITRFQLHAEWFICRTFLVFRLMRSQPIAAGTCR